MKATYEAVFTAAVIEKVKKAQELGIKASWRTQDHLAALAKVLVQESNNGENIIEHSFNDVLTDCYNVSAFQQSLAKKFAATGHFQRTAEKGAKEKVDDLLAQFAATLTKPAA